MTLAVKKRISRAKKSAEKLLMDMGYDVIRSDNKKACLVGICASNVRVIRIVLDNPSQQDHRELCSIEAPPSCLRELWIRKIGTKDFSVHRI